MIVMKKIFSSLAAVTVWTLLFAACSNSTSSDTSTTAPPKQDNSTALAANRSVLLTADSVYTCEMHQQVIGPKPGHCSICGMKLIKQKPTAGQKKIIQDSTYRLPKE